MTRINMKGRDMENLVFLGRVKTVNVEFCNESKTMAKVVATLDTSEEVETECIPIRAAGKISTVMKHYLRLGVGNYIIKEGDVSGNVDMEGGDEDETQN
ncbi:hypothetical protein L3N51_00944 [Metallosphaera sp. J1]|uniref:hypothetical protein n=1 Tax=Metallosphaera javensis (ex Hofmann et al. 2022) TaxID=99938 RepID=UPI001EDCDFAC|nr:hypothetical protein [Metallosphaera javensis (ex Hofmann et al. 2022)]MCG3108660.1 hypothetical protein [Metallosphaera javensis (ex Hofmann et al. 2022)]